MLMVAPGGIEPSTHGFSIQSCSKKETKMSLFTLQLLVVWLIVTNSK